MNYYYVIYYVKSFIRKDDDVCLSFHCCAPIFSPFSPTCRVFMYCAPYQVNKNNDYNEMRVVNHTGFGHFEYWYAKDADKLVHDEIVSMMKDAAYRIANPITKIRELGYFYHAFLIPFVLHVPISFSI